MTNINRITNEEIIALNDVRKRPCITEGGECHIVSRIIIFHDGDLFKVRSVDDVNVHATEREAREWVAKMMLSANDSCYAIKRSYTIRCHHVF